VIFLPIDEQRFTRPIGLSNNISNRSVFNLSLKSHHYYRLWGLSDLRSASPIIITIWKVVFANNSQKLGSIWMKLDTWGWLPEKTKPCTFTAKSRNRFRRECEKIGRRGKVFLWRARHTTSTTFLGSISAKLSTSMCPGGGSRHVVSHSRKVSSIKGSNFPKNRLFRVQKGTKTNILTD